MPDPFLAPAAPAQPNGWIPSLSYDATVAEALSDLAKGGLDIGTANSPGADSRACRALEALGRKADLAEASGTAFLLETALRRALHDLPKDAFVALRGLVADSTVELVRESQGRGLLASLSPDSDAGRLQSLLENVPAGPRRDAIRQYLPVLSGHIDAVAKLRVDMFNADAFLFHVKAMLPCLRLRETGAPQVYSGLECIAQAVAGGELVRHEAVASMRSAVLEVDAATFAALTDWENALNPDAFLDGITGPQEERARFKEAVRVLRGVIQDAQRPGTGNRGTRYAQTRAESALTRVAAVLDALASNGDTLPWLPLASHGRTRPFGSTGSDSQLCWDSASVDFSEALSRADTLQAVHGQDGEELGNQMARLGAMLTVLREGLHWYAPGDNLVMRLLRGIASAIRRLTRPRCEAHDMRTVVARVRADLNELAGRVERSKEICEGVVRTFADRASSGNGTTCPTAEELNSVVRAMKALSAVVARSGPLQFGRGPDKALLVRALTLMKEPALRASMSDDHCRVLSTLSHDPQ